MARDGGVLDENIDHPAYRPDSDLVDALIACCQRETNRLTVGNIFGSLLVAMKVVIFSRTTAGKQVTEEQVRGLSAMIALYLHKGLRERRSDLTLIKD